MDVSLVITNLIPVHIFLHLTEVRKNQMAHQRWHYTPDQKWIYISHVPSQAFPLPPWILVFSTIDIRTDPNKVNQSDQGISSFVFKMHPLSNNQTSYNCHEFVSQKAYLLRVVWLQACIKHFYRLDPLKHKSLQSKFI